MTTAGRKQCVVVYATSEQQDLWTVDVADTATIGEAIDTARRIAKRVDVPWDTAPVGIFGELRSRADCPQDGDRIELYRPLRSDPRDRRREKVQRQRREAFLK